MIIGGIYHPCVNVVPMVCTPNHSSLVLRRSIFGSLSEFLILIDSCTILLRGSLSTLVLCIENSHSSKIAKN